MRSSTGIALAGLAVGLMASASHASLSITTLNTPVVEDFTGFAGAGFMPGGGVGMLDSNTWRPQGLSTDSGFAFGGTNTGGDFARGASGGGVSTGGIYAFDIGGGDVGLGVQPGGSDFTPGTITLRIQNDTGATITDLDIDYDVYIFNDADRANSFNFAWSDDDSTYNLEAALDLVSPEAADATPAWVQHNRMISLSGLSIANGASFYIQWIGDDVSGGGSRDEFALDNVSINAVPAPAGLAVLVLAGVGLGRRRRS